MYNDDTIKLSNMVTQIEYSSISDVVLEKAKNCFIDFLGLAIVGSSSKQFELVNGMLNKWEVSGSSLVLATGNHTNPANASFLNSIAAHSLELDDFHRESSVHPSVVVIPAAIAVAQYAQKSGEDLLLAIIVGYEVALRIGCVTSMNLLKRGFHPTSTCGIFGAAAAAGKLLNLDVKTMASALGVAGSMASGLREWKMNGAMTKPLQVGKASNDGLLAALLASCGFEGPSTILEGEQGFGNAYANVRDFSSVTMLDNNSFLIEDISFKPYSSCRFTHPAIDGILQLKLKYDIKPSQIKSIEVELSSEMYRAVMWPERRKYAPKNIIDAQFSLPYCLAISILFGEPLVEHFTNDLITDTNILCIASKVKAHVSQKIDSQFPKYNRQVITVTLNNGNRLTKDVPYPKGDPENPMLRRDIINKFSSLLSWRGYSKYEDIINMVINLEKYDISEISSILLGLCKKS